MTPRRSPGLRKVPRRGDGSKKAKGRSQKERELGTVGRIVSESDLVAAIAADRAAGWTIALANGCFDLLHVGHIRYLQGAAAEADRLIVAVNDDGAVARLKGPGRPAMPAGERAEIIAAIGVV